MGGQMNYASAKAQLESQKGAANGFAGLDANGKVPDSQLPAILPTVTSADNGKVLGVANGSWSVITIPSANGVNF